MNGCLISSGFVPSLAFQVYGGRPVELWQPVTVGSEVPLKFLLQRRWTTLLAGCLVLRYALFRALYSRNVTTSLLCFDCESYLPRICQYPFSKQVSTHIRRPRFYSHMHVLEYTLQIAL